MEKNLSEDELRRHILVDLAARTPWNNIAKKYHVSPNPISRIRKEGEASRQTQILSDEDQATLYSLQGIFGAKTLSAAISEAHALCLQITPFTKILGIHQADVIKHLLQQIEDVKGRLNEFTDYFGDAFFQSEAREKLEMLHNYLVRQGYRSSISVMVEELIDFVIKSFSNQQRMDYFTYL
jgi:hypothetical protein